MSDSPGKKGKPGFVLLLSKGNGRQLFRSLPPAGERLLRQGSSGELRLTRQPFRGRNKKRPPGLFLGCSRSAVKRRARGQSHTEAACSGNLLLHLRTACTLLRIFASFMLVRDGRPFCHGKTPPFPFSYSYANTVCRDGNGGRSGAAHPLAISRNRCASSVSARPVTGAPAREARMFSSSGIPSVPIYNPLYPRYDKIL